MKSTIINKNVFDEIEKKFKVLAVIDSIDYINNLKHLDSQLKEFSNITFEITDRILIFYQDTGYYIDLNHGTSVFFNNLYTLLCKYNIPPEFIIIFTNHYGLKKEINTLNKKLKYSINNIIETSLWYDFPTLEKINEVTAHPLIFENKFLYTCLNNAPRVHRNYTLCQLKENHLLNSGIVSYRFNK